MTCLFSVSTILEHLGACALKAKRGGQTRPHSPTAQDEGGRRPAPWLPLGVSGPVSVESSGRTHPSAPHSLLTDTPPPSPCVRGSVRCGGGQGAAKPLHRRDSPPRMTVFGVSGARARRKQERKREGDAGRAGLPFREGLTSPPAPSALGPPKLLLGDRGQGSGHAQWAGRLGRVQPQRALG